MKFFLLCLWFLIPFIISAQSSDVFNELELCKRSEYEDGMVNSIYCADINSDGILDTVEKVLYTSPTFPEVSVVITNGASRQKLTWACEYYSGSVLASSFVDTSWLLPENQQFYQVLLNGFLSPVGDSHSCLKWMESLRQIKKQGSTFESLFEERYTFFVNWQEGLPTLPNNSANIYNKPHNEGHLLHIPFKFLTLPEWWYNERGYCFIEFLGRNLWQPYEFNDQFYSFFSDTIVDVPLSNSQLSTYTAQVIKHGVVIYDGTNEIHQWIFLSGNEATGGPEKLRWESIADVALIDHYAFILQGNAPDPVYSLWIADFQNGKLGKVLNTENPMDAEVIKPDMQLTEQALILNFKGRELRWNISDLMEALSK